MDLWLPQEKAIDDIVGAIADGKRVICYTSPTGGGKTTVVGYVMRHFREQGWHAILYTNRVLLLKQVAASLTKFGLEVGIRAAGHEDQRELPVQVASIQTEAARTLKADGPWQMHGGGRNCIVFVDEAHLNATGNSLLLIERHLKLGHAVVGVTATPLDVWHVYKDLVIGGNNTQLRACGALVPAYHYGPDEPDFKALKLPQQGDVSDTQATKAIMQEGIYGRVIEWFNKLNPNRRPTILFAPGVEESLYFCRAFRQAGITAGHIDGEFVDVDGTLLPANDETRGELLNGSESGRIEVLCNRFVLREGIDAPWLQHGIFATVFGSLQSYLQSGGRLLRSHTSHDRITVQDHGGNWWRWGSLNSDRDWTVGITADMMAGVREERLRAKKEKEPRRCSKCGMILGCRVCPGCGFEFKATRFSRPVVQSDGTLKEMFGDIFLPRRVAFKPDTLTKWKSMYYRSKTEKGKKSFRAAMALFAHENHYWPSPTLPFMPLHEHDFYRYVGDVPMERLRGMKSDAS